MTWRKHPIVQHCTRESRSNKRVQVRVLVNAPVRQWVRESWLDQDARRFEYRYVSTDLDRRLVPESRRMKSFRKPGSGNWQTPCCVARHVDAQREADLPFCRKMDKSCQCSPAPIASQRLSLPKKLRRKVVLVSCLVQGVTIISRTKCGLWQRDNAARRSAAEGSCRCRQFNKSP